MKTKTETWRITYEDTLTGNFQSPVSCPLAKRLTEAKHQYVTVWFTYWTAGVWEAKDRFIRVIRPAFDPQAYEKLRTTKKPFQFTIELPEED